MAKPNLTKKQQQNRANRRKNQSPAMERKRAENAWHTNALAPIPPKVLRQQAKNLMRTLYAPSFKQLGREESRLNSISEKRKSDNSYYLNWLTKQSELLQAHEDQARTSVNAAGAAAQQEVQAGWDELQSKLVADGNTAPGVVSNMGEAKAFDTTAAAAKSNAEIENQRAATEAQQERNIGAASISSANNFALMASSEAKRVADQWEGLSKLGDAKQELRLSRAADAAKEVARSLDKEIEKSQARAQIAASSASATLEAKRLGLDRKKLGLEEGEFDFEKGESRRKYGLEKRKTRNEERKIGNEEKDDARSRSEKGEDARRDARQKNQEINAKVYEGVNFISNNPNLQAKIERNPQAVLKRLQTVLVSPFVARIAFQLYTQGHVGSGVRKQLKAIGYTGKILKQGT